MQFYSQEGQDRFLFERFFRAKKGGTFVDIGAYDGTTYSNTLFFEKYLDWTGLCVEPLPTEFQKLTACRTAKCVNCCVADFEGVGEFLVADTKVDAKMLSGLVQNYDRRHVARIDNQATGKQILQVPVKTLTSLLNEHKLFSIDYCSIDTEGSELSILRSLDFERFDIAVFTIENNYRDDAVPAFMAQKGYELVHSFGGFDQLYKKKSSRALGTTVICSVWHGDPNRVDLLTGHSASLDRQTRPVERIYVFDGGDKPPANVQGHVVSCRENLSIYQAWNVALSLVRTPYVMNLNLDDRLAPDAVALLESVLDAGNDLVGGDWRICYNQPATDAVILSSPADSLPFVPAWPPAAGTVTRLGSGTGLRGTLGPACMWRAGLHQLFPQFPYQFGDGTLIRVIGDAVWWRLLLQNKKKIQRLPRIIGNYHSHPQEQAEFRNPAAGEEQTLRKVGVRCW